MKKVLNISNYKIMVIRLLLCFGMATSILAQQDTLMWNYVINQSWVKPPLLDTFVGIHPRMLLDSATIDTLKIKINLSHKFIWDKIQNKADQYLALNPADNPDSEDDTRDDGDAIPWMAMAYLFTNDAKYLTKALSWMSAICNYPNWQNNRSLAAGHCLLGVSFGYDWLYHSMSPDQRNTIRDRLSFFASELAKNPVHKERYLSNHCQVEYTGLAAAGFALYDELPEAEDWLRQSYLIFNEAFQIFGSDGGSTEGHQYYGLMTEFQMHYLKLAKKLLGRDFYQESGWLKNLGNFILYCTLPDFSYDNLVMRFGDTRYFNYVSHGPSYQLFNVACEYRDPHFQWLALEMFNRGIGSTHRMGWANLLWYDETIETAPPDSLTTFRHFDDTGWVTSRSDWSEKAIMVGFKCGPFHGHSVQNLYDNMANYQGLVNGHGHPDVNHFNIYGYGKWLAKDDGYSKPKWTKYHNTLLIDDIGQLGEGSDWFNRTEVFYARAKSSIIKAQSNNTFDYIIGDAENIYKPETGLKKFLRHFIYLKPDFIIVLDELRAEQPAQFEWLLHTDGNIHSIANNKFLITIDDIVMDIDFLIPQDLSNEIEQEFLKVYPSNKISDTYILSVMHPRKTSDPPDSINMVSQQDSVLQMEIWGDYEGKNIIIDLVNQNVEVTAISNLQDESSCTNPNFRLHQNYPNPFNPSTTIAYQIPASNRVLIKIFDLLGNEVTTLIDEYHFAGNYYTFWNGIDEMGNPVSSGIYVYRLKVGEFINAKKMVLLR